MDLILRPPKLKRGDEVTVTKKMTWPLPTKSNPATGRIFLYILI